MAVDSQYNDSAHLRNPEQTKDAWQSLGEVTDRLKRKCVEAMSKGQSEVAEEYHARLLEVEHAARGGDV